MRILAAFILLCHTLRLLLLRLSSVDQVSIYIVLFIAFLSQKLTLLISEALDRYLFPILAGEPFGVLDNLVFPVYQVLVLLF